MFRNRTLGNTHLQQSKKRSLKKNVLYIWGFQFPKNFLHCNLLLKILYAGSFIAKLICCWRKVLWNKLEGRSAGQSHGIFIHEPKPSASIIIIIIIVIVTIIITITLYFWYQEAHKEQYFVWCHGLGEKHCFLALTAYSYCLLKTNVGWNKLSKVERIIKYK